MKPPTKTGVLPKKLSLMHASRTSKAVAYGAKETTKAENDEASKNAALEEELLEVAVKRYK